jgi:phage tail sheath protein FI
MSKPYFGMSFSEIQAQPRPALGADFSKVLCIESSEDADAAKYPLDTFVRISTSDADAVSKLGTGLLADMIAGINANLTGLNAGADVVVARVAEGVDNAATSASIVAMLEKVQNISSEVNCTPRIILAGRTVWRVDLETTNPVVAALQIACGKLLAAAPVDVDDATKEVAIDARETMDHEGVFPIGIMPRVAEGETIVTRSAAARVAGLMIRNDNKNGGKPFKPFANQPLYGIVGLSRPLPFSLLDGSTEGQQLLSAGVSIIVAGETGVDGAIADGGFTFIGVDHSKSNAVWKQIHQVRGANYLKIKMVEITRQFLGREISPGVTEAWLNSLKSMLANHKAQGDIIDFKLNFTADKNNPTQIALGHLVVEIKQAPLPAFTHAEHQIGTYDEAYISLVDDIVSRLETNQAA